MSNLKTLKVGTEVILEAISFTHPKNIEKSAPSIQWTITPKDGNSENIGTGKAIKYKIPDKYKGKNVVFRAFIKEESKQPLQKLTCFVEGQVSVEGILIKKASPPINASVGDRIECKVTEYMWVKLPKLKKDR